MPTVLETGAAALIAGYIVAGAKHAWPSAPSAGLILIALAAGIGAAFLAQISSTGVHGLTDRVIASLIMQGIVAAAGAAGLTRTDGSGEAKRRAAVDEEAA